MNVIRRPAPFTFPADLHAAAQAAGATVTGAILAKRERGLRSESETRPLPKMCPTHDSS